MFTNLIVIFLNRINILAEFYMFYDVLLKFCVRAYSLSNRTYILHFQKSFSISPLSVIPNKVSKSVAYFGEKEFKSFNLI